VPGEYTAALEELYVVLAATRSQSIPPDELAAMVIPGLLALGAIARGAAAGSLAAQPLGWTFSLQPAPMKAMTLTIHRPGTQPSVLYAQLDRDFRLNSLFTLALGDPARGQLLSFDLEKTSDGWFLRRWQDDSRVRFPMQVPAGAPVPWSFHDSAEMWDQFLPASPASALGAVLQALHSAPASPPPPASEPSPGTPESIAPEPAPGAPQPVAGPSQPATREPVTGASQASTREPAAGTPPPAPQPAADQTAHIPQPKAAFPDLILVNQETGQKIPLKARLTIGRGEDSDLRIDDREMSRSHALIVPVPLGWQLQDLNSTNGTWLNDNRLFEATMLHPADRLRFGNTRFRVESP
jgi:hypothetical protein